MSDDLDLKFWDEWGEEINKAHQDMDEFGRTRCRICGCYKFTNDIAICMDCSLNNPLRNKLDRDACDLEGA